MFYKRLKRPKANPNWSLNHIGEKFPKISTKTEGNYPKYQKIAGIKSSL
jgi:hypothetical protein